MTDSAKVMSCWTMKMFAFKLKHFEFLYILTFQKDIVTSLSVCSEGERVVPEALSWMVPDIHLVQGSHRALLWDTHLHTTAELVLPALMVVGI